MLDTYPRITHMILSQGGFLLEGAVLAIGVSLSFLRWNASQVPAAWGESDPKFIVGEGDLLPGGGWERAWEQVVIPTPISAMRVPCRVAQIETL